MNFLNYFTLSYSSELSTDNLDIDSWKEKEKF